MYFWPTSFLDPSWRPVNCPTYAYITGMTGMASEILEHRYASLKLMPMVSPPSDRGSGTLTPSPHTKQLLRSDEYETIEMSTSTWILDGKEDAGLGRRAGS